MSAVSQLIPRTESSILIDKGNSAVGWLRPASNQSNTGPAGD